MTRWAVIEVGGRILVMLPVMPPDRVSAVASSKPVPVRVTSTAEAAGNGAVAMPVSVGVGAVMVNAGGVAFEPLGVVTITLTAPSVAEADIAKLASIELPSGAMLLMTAVISGPALSVVAPNRAVPAMITCCIVLGNNAPPLSPVAGVMPVITGSENAVIVKSAVRLVPAAVVTEMGQAPNGPGPRVKVAVIWVALTTVTLLTTIGGAGRIAGQAVMVVTGKKLAPLMVTVWVVSAWAWAGANDRFVGFPAEICQIGP